MLRDNLKSLIYFEEEIEYSNEIIEENKDEIKDLQEDIKNGISRFPKDNQSIIYSTYQTSAMYEVKKICALYSAGKPIEDINQELEYTITCMENEGDNRIGYLNLLWIISIGILLETDKNNIQRLSKLVEKENIKDFVIDYLLYSYDIGRTRIVNTYYKEQPYSNIREIIDLAHKDKTEASKRMQKYMEKEWFKGHYDYEWKNAHKEPGYVGYWSFDTAALAKILELDDSSLVENNHYPYDLRHYKNTLKFSQISIDELKSESNHECIQEIIEGIERNPILEKIIPSKWHSFINELIEDYGALEDNSFYDKYKESIGLGSIWFLFEEYEKENENKDLLGTLIIFALVEKEYILQLDYKEDLEEYHSSVKNYWNDSEVKVIQFILNNDQKYYTLVPKNVVVQEIYEVKIVDLEEKR